MKQLNSLLYTFIFLVTILTSACVPQALPASVPTSSVLEGTQVATPGSIGIDKTPTVQSSPTDTQIPPSETPQVTVSSTSTSSPTETPTQTPIPNLEIIYAVTNESNGAFYSEVWIFDIFTGQKELVFSTSPGSGIPASSVKWHPVDKNVIYYVLVEGEQDFSWALWKYDMQQEQAERVSEHFPMAIGTLTLWSSWSLDGNWVRIYTEDRSKAVDVPGKVSYTFINIETGIATVIEQLSSAWSPLISNEIISFESGLGYAEYHMVLRDLQTSNIIQEVDAEPITSQIKNDAYNNNVNLSWLYPGDFLIVSMDKGNESTLFSYNFQSNTWNRLQEISYASVELISSPRGEWLAILDKFRQISVLNQNELTQPQQHLLSGSVLNFETWIENPERMIVSSENKLWLIDPMFPQQKIELIDLGTLELKPGHNIDIRESK